MSENQKIDVADIVGYTLGDEKWTVAANHNGRVYWCGYPFGGSVPVEQCFLVKKATEKEKLYLLVELSKMTSSTLPVLLAKATLGTVPQDTANDHTVSHKDDLKAVEFGVFLLHLTKVGVISEVAAVSKNDGRRIRIGTMEWVSSELKKLNITNITEVKG